MPPQNSNYKIKDVKIISWNAAAVFQRGDKKNVKRAELMKLLDDENPDILCIQESHIVPSGGRNKEHNEFIVPGYQVFRFDVPGIHCEISKTSKSEGNSHTNDTTNRGVCVLVKDRIVARNVKKECFCFGMWQTVEILQPGKNETAFHITNLYIRPGVPIKNKVYDKWNEIEKLFNSYDTHIITGDFNRHCLSFNENRNPNAYMIGEADLLDRLFLDKNYEVLNSGEITHIPRAKGQKESAIDGTLVRGDNLIGKCHWEILDDLNGSDHFPQKITINDYVIIKPAEGNTTLEFKDYKADWVKYRDRYVPNMEELDKVKGGAQTGIWLTSHVNSIVQTQSIPNNHKYLNKPVPEAKERKRTDWFWDESCTRAKKERNRLLRIWQKDRSNDEKNQQYRIAQKKFIGLIKTAQRKANLDVLESIDPLTNSKDAWKKIKALEGKPDNKIKVGNLKKGNNFCSSDFEKAEHLKNHYVKTSSDENLLPEFLAKKREREKTEEYQKINRKKPNDLQHSYNKPFTMKDMMRQLKKKNKRSAAGKDGITYKMIRYAPLCVREALLRIYNDIWETGVIPPEFKEGIILPILKPGKPSNEASSYRPITLTPHVAKLLESMVKFRLSNFLEAKGIITPTNSGFQCKREVMDQLARLDRIVRNNAYGKVDKETGLSDLGGTGMTGAVFLDVKAAFDTADHFTILKHLDKYGINGNMYNFCLDFLKGRTFQVRVGNSLSTKGNPTNGVPQGSVLSPTLFLLSINEIDKVITKEKDGIITEILCYADDTALVFTLPKNAYRKNVKMKCEQWMSEQTNKVIEALQEIGYRVNKEKTQAIILNNVMNVKENNRGIVYKRGSLKRDTLKKELKCKRGKGYHRPKNVSIWRLTIGNTIIHTQREVKYLGVIFDTHYNFKAHLKEKYKSGLSALNIIRRVAGWGGFRKSPRLLRGISKGLLESRLHYGAEITGGCDNKAEQNRNDSLIYRARAIIAGAKWGTKKEALDMFLGELSPEMTREYMKCRYLARKLTSKTHFSQYLKGEEYRKNSAKFEVLNPVTFEKHEIQQGGLFRDTVARWTKLGLDGNLAAEIDLTNKSTSEEWPELEIDTSLHKKINKESNEIVIRKEMQWVQNTYTDFFKIYTDGSRGPAKENEKIQVTGLGIHAPAQAPYTEGEINEAARSSDNLAIASVEMIAIGRAMELLKGDEHSDYMIKELPKKAVIFSDSLSALQALKSENLDKGRSDLMSRVRHNHAQLVKEKDMQVVVAWVPSHVGIDGNEKADTLAKQGAELVHKEFDVKLGYTEIKSLIHASFKEEVNENWKKSNHPSTNYIEKVQHKRYPLAKQYVKRNRLILNKPACMLDKNAKCEVCESVKLSVQHIVMECKKYDQNRNILKNAYSEEGVQFSLKNVLDIFPAHNLIKENLEYINSIDNI